MMHRDHQERPPKHGVSSWALLGIAPRNKKTSKSLCSAPSLLCIQGWLPYTAFLYLASYPPPANMIECVHTALCSRYTCVGGHLHTGVCVHVWNHMYMGMCSPSLHWN